MGNKLYSVAPYIFIKVYNKLVKTYSYSMLSTKVLKDRLVKFLLGQDYVPGSLYDCSEYFRHYSAIKFEYHNEDGLIVAVSTDFKYGSIITSAKNEKELDRNIKDAILTSFEVPSVYLDKVNLYKVGDQMEGYALA